jgi:hypothetical protein
VALLQIRRYTATATVQIVPTSTPGGRADPAAIVSYQRLSESAYLMRFVTDEFQTRYGSADRVSFRASVYPTGNGVTMPPYLPFIGLTATAARPDDAKAAADLWADVFIRRWKELISEGDRRAFVAVVEEFPLLEGRIADAANQLQLLNQAHAAELGDLKARLRLADMERELSELNALKSSLTTEAERAVIEGSGASASVAAFEQALKTTPTLLEQVGIRAGVGHDADAINPVFTELQLRIADARARERAAQARARIAKVRLTELGPRQAELDEALRLTRARIEQVQQRQNAAQKQLQHEIDGLRSAHEKMKDQYSNAQVLAGMYFFGVKIATPAQRPTAPSAPNVTSALQAGAVAGLVLSLMYVWITLPVGDAADAELTGSAE